MTKLLHDTFRMEFDTQVHLSIRVGNWKLRTGQQGFDEWVEPPEWQNNSSARESDNDAGLKS